MRGKENQELGGLGISHLKGSETEFTSTIPSHQTSDPSTYDPTKDYDFKTRSDPSLNNKAHTDPSLNIMGGILSSTGITLTFDTLIRHLAGASEARLPESAV